MQIKVKRFDKTLPLPVYKTDGSVCMDAYARETVIIHPQEIGYIPLNVAIEVPKGYWVLVAARSSTHKMGLLPAGGIGIGDSDYCGDNDEYRFIALNYKKMPVTIEKGTRVAQIMIIQYQKVEIEEVEKMDNPDRGGIGSTGNF